MNEFDKWVREVMEIPYADGLEDLWTYCVSMKMHEARGCEHVDEFLHELTKYHQTNVYRANNADTNHYLDLATRIKKVHDLRRDRGAHGEIDPIRCTRCGRVGMQ